jgi:hypothetical protein
MAKKDKRKHQHEGDDESGATLTRDPEAEDHAREDGHKHTGGSEWTRRTAREDEQQGV